MRRYLIIALTTMTVLLMACYSWSPETPQKVTGTIYFADNRGIWKLKPPDNNSVLLANHNFLLVDYLSLSPEQRWLAYAGAQRDETGKVFERLWIIPNQGGEPLEVSRDVILPSINWINGELLFKEGQSTFRFDPTNGRRTVVEAIKYPTDCYVSLSPTNIDTRLESCGPSEISPGYLRVVTVNSSQPITISQPYKNNDSAQWSTDGQTILFMDGVLDYEKLFLWALKSGQMRQITGEISQNNYTFSDLSWSPDNKWVAFEGAKNGNDLCVSIIVTGEVQCIQDIVSVLGQRIVWSPDSRAVLIVSNRIGQMQMGDTKPQWDLFSVDIPNGKMVRLTNSGEIERLAVWGR